MLTLVRAARRQVCQAAGLRAQLTAPELKRRMKAEKKAAEKDAKVKDQVPQNKDTNDKAQQNAYGADEETLDPNLVVMIKQYHNTAFTHYFSKRNEKAINLNTFTVLWGLLFLWLKSSKPTEASC
uniref:Uncharacterized protein n=1 Tax=Astyanax mexicanus TaxID=7994 RepID=A0A8B9JRE3_ASTMX